MSKVLAICISLLLVSTTYATTLGNWEDTDGDGWGGWISSAVVPASPLPITLSNGVTYSQDTTTGVKLGSNSLKVSTIPGWGQFLAISLDYGQRVEFMANSKFAIDFTVAAGTTGGWNEVYNVTLNAEGYGWHDQFTAPAAHYDFWNGSPVRSRMISFDYTAAKASMPAIPGYIQIIFALNGSTGAQAHEMYFDYARLTPEPATMALLGLGGLALIRRKR